MIIKAEQLTSKLKKIAAVYFISGDEPLLLLEACDQVRLAARKAGFEDREVFNVDNKFDWGQFFASADNLSLFGGKKLIELRFQQKPNTAGRDALLRYCEQINPDNVLLISMPKIDASTKKSKWFKALDTAGVVTQVWPLSARQLPAWLGQRLQAVNLKASPEALQLISERVEGNLLAAKQEVEKLALLFTEGSEISAEDILQVTGDSYRYDVFTLVDHCLAGNVSMINKVLNGLKEEGTEAILVLWALTREIHSLINMVEFMQSGNNLHSAYQQFRVWDNRKALMDSFFKRCKLNALYRFLQLSSEIDQQIKGIKKGSPWESLLTLSLNFAGYKIN
jgi:DNA polymerase-3 subunit delta